MRFASTAEALAPTAKPKPPTAIRELTIGAAIILFQLHGGPIARQYVAELQCHAPTMRGRFPQDLCTVVMLGLANCDRKHGARLTERGRRWLYPYVGR